MDPSGGRHPSHVPRCGRVGTRQGLDLQGLDSTAFLVSSDQKTLLSIKLTMPKASSVDQFSTLVYNVEVWKPFAV